MLRRLLTILPLIALTTGILLGQAFYGSIVGTVNDSSGAALASTTVVLTNIDRGDRRTVLTGADGSYRFVNLVPGTYRMEIEHAGFKRYTRDQIDVSVESQVRADIVMQVGDVNQSVEVQAEAPLLGDIGRVEADRDRHANDPRLDHRTVQVVAVGAPPEEEPRQNRHHGEAEG